MQRLYHFLLIEPFSDFYRKDFPLKSREVIFDLIDFASKKTKSKDDHLGPKDLVVLV